MDSREERLQRQKQLQQLREEVERELKQIPGVVGVGIGFKMTNSETVEEIVVQVFIEEKKSPDEILPEQMIPREIRGIPTTNAIVNGKHDNNQIVIAQFLAVCSASILAETLGYAVAFSSS